MENLADNYIIKFKNVSNKQNCLFANFVVKAMRGGITITSKISVDISSLELHAKDSLEKIIDGCAKKAIKEFKRNEIQFEKFFSFPNDYLGVAQLG